MTERRIRKDLTRRSRPDDITLVMSGLAQDSYAQLYLLLSELPDIDADTLSIVRHLGEGYPQDIATTMAMVGHVAIECTQIVEATGDQRIKLLLSNIQSALSGIGDSRPVLKIANLHKSR